MVNQVPIEIIKWRIRKGNWTVNLAAEVPYCKKRDVYLREMLVDGLVTIFYEYRKQLPLDRGGI